MNSQNYFAVLRDLSESFSRHQINEQEYRIQRQTLLDQIERDVNGPQSIPDNSDHFIDHGGDQFGYDTQIFESDVFMSNLESLEEIKKKQ